VDGRRHGADRHAREATGQPPPDMLPASGWSVLELQAAWLSSSNYLTLRQAVTPEPLRGRVTATRSASRWRRTPFRRLWPDAG